MAKDYKLCPKCNNALDNNVMQCPYCGENIGISFGSNNHSQTPQILTNQPKSSKGCLIFFIIFFLLPVIGSILSLVFRMISSFFD